ncbi:MAG: hypothetical protein QUS35_01335 [bacterium]|nr:hypothetical protein [bacterium]
MKKARFIPLLALAPALLFGQAANEKGKVFTVKLGPNHQASQIGLAGKRLQPYAGLDYLSASFTADMGLLMWAENPSTLELVKALKIGAVVDGSVSFWMPHAGAKYYLADGESRPYVFGGVYRNFSSIDAALDLKLQGYDENGEEAGDPMSSDTDLLEDDLKEFVESLLNHWGVQAGFGVEWRVNRHFGLGGEYGVKLNFNSAEQKFNDTRALELLGLLLGDTGTEPDAGLDDLLGAGRTDLDLKLSGKYVSSQASVVFNFYF